MNDNYDYGVDFKYSDVPWSPHNIVWLSETKEKPAIEEITTLVDSLNEQEPYKQLRKLRDEKLSDCDWVTLKAYSQGVPVSEEWATYMQELRDITDNCTPILDSNGDLDLTSIVWPTKPE